MSSATGVASNALDLVTEPFTTNKPLRKTRANNESRSLSSTKGIRQQDLDEFLKRGGTLAGGGGPSPISEFKPKETSEREFAGFSSEKSKGFGAAFDRVATTFGAGQGFGELADISQERLEILENVFLRREQSIATRRGQPGRSALRS